MRYYSTRHFERVHHRNVSSALVWAHRLMLSVAAIILWFVTLYLGVKGVVGA